MLHEKGYTNLTGGDLEDYLDEEVRAFASCKPIDFNTEPLPWGDRSFDAVISWEVMEHLENPFHFVREIARVLKPGGLFLFSTPNIQHLTNKIQFLRTGDMPRWRARNDHIALFPKGVFGKVFLRQFSIVEKGFVRGEFQYKIFNLFRWPENELFGNTVYYVLRRNEAGLSSD